MNWPVSRLQCLQGVGWTDRAEGPTVPWQGAVPEELSGGSHWELSWGEPTGVAAPGKLKQHKPEWWLQGILSGSAPAGALWAPWMGMTQAPQIIRSTDGGLGAWGLSPSQSFSCRVMPGKIIPCLLWGRALASESCVWVESYPDHFGLCDLVSVT